jgi:AcrR family transcriptional regulator
LTATARNISEIEPRRRARKARQGPVTREQILDGSLRLFSEKGFARTSVRDIAQAAGITDAAIYYHFASKRELFEALIEERGFTAALENLERAEVTLPPEQAIPLIARNALAFIYQNRDLMKVLMVEAMADDPVATEEYAALSRRWKRAEARILRIYAERGQLRTDDVDELAEQLVVTVLGVFSDYLMSPSPVPDNGDVPPALFRHVDVAMQNIVLGVTSAGP